MLESIAKSISFRKCANYGAFIWCSNYAAPNKGTTILYWLRPKKTVLNPLANGKIQRLFKAFDCFSSTYQGKFYFQGLFKTVLYIQCANPE